MLPVVTADEMRALDALTIKERGIPGAVLMENAGRAVVDCVRSIMAAQSGDHVVVLCGAGNNGGDGYVVARVLQERGVSTSLYAAAPVERLKGDASLHAQAFLHCGGSALPLREAAHLQAAREDFERCALIVDALFGTGLDREIAGHYRQIIEAVNQARATVVAIDLPSGLNADQGRVMGVAVQADATVTLACAKVANVSAPGFAACGQLHIAEIGVPGAEARALAHIELLEAQDVRNALRGDSANSHKGSRGHVLAIAGSKGKQGAGRLADLAALRAGCGLVTLAAQEVDASAEDPLMTAQLRELAGLEALLVGKGAILIGPGMATGAPGRDLVLGVLASSELPMVLDADALNHLGSELGPVAASKAPVVLTPHPGEAGRLLGLSTAQVQADRIAAVRALAAKSKAVVVLKGARTCICDGREAPKRVVINPTGGPELSTAGTGDVLTGMLASLLAQGIAPTLAAWAAVYWHGEAGRLASAELGGPGMVASDLIAALPASRVCV